MPRIRKNRGGMASVGGTKEVRFAELMLDAVFIISRSVVKVKKLEKRQREVVDLPETSVALRGERKALGGIRTQTRRVWYVGKPASCIVLTKQ